MAERAERTPPGRGEPMEVAGVATPIELRPAPAIAADAGDDLLTIKHGSIFVSSGRNGDIDPQVASGHGLYFEDTRYLSLLRLAVGGREPLLLTATADPGYEAFAELTNPELRDDEGPIEQMTLNIRRRRVASRHLHERIEVRNHCRRRVTLAVEIAVGCDFADIFEVRGVRSRMSRGRLLVPDLTPDLLRFGYIGEDEVVRETLIHLTPPATVTAGPDHSALVSWHLTLDPRESSAVELVAGPSRKVPQRAAAFSDAERSSREDDERWKSRCTRFQALHHSFNRFLAAGARDLAALRTPIGDCNIFVAGLPWYAAPFGRDMLLTTYESLLLNPDPARDALLFLADRQARADDAARDAEPGKILHELRFGELANAGYIPHTPYYGTADATPLFLMLAAAYYRWTNDVETMARLKPALDRALEWIDTYGDRDADGFVEYHRRSHAGLANQGWKDSHDSIVHADGSLAEGPIALVEVQGYVYLAKRRIAEVLAALGEPQRARELEQQAETLKAAFNEAFWMPEESTLALALDGSKKQVKSVTSNAGHSLYTAIIDDDKADAMARRLMAEDMFSGWGIRTLSSDSPAYNPMSYHNGSVWPHDNAIIAAGLKRYGHSEATERIALALADAAVAARDARLPELYCGFRRRGALPFIHYPVACRPQAWAAAVPFMLVQSMLGISANAPDNTLSINEPQLPDWLGTLEIDGLRVGDSKVSLSFTRDGERTAFSLVERDGDVRVSLHAA